MSDTYTGFFDGWQNARQRQTIRDLGGEISSLSSSLSRQRQESSRLRSQLSQLQGTLEHRVNRLASSLEALVELSDVRQILAMFDPPALIRHRAREAITGIGSAGAPAWSPGEDVPDYWLGPAVQALVALVRGDEAAGALAAAEHRDRGRTALLLTCGLVVAGRGELADRWLPDALGRLSPGTPVTQAQRALWTLAADGRFGAAGEAVLRRHLTELVGGLTPEQDRAESEAWTGLANGLRSGAVRVPAVVKDDASVRRCLDAGGRLSALRELCCPAPVDAGADKVALDLVTEVLHSLVDEGTPEEAPLLRRAAQLRAAIEDGEGSSPAAGWDSAAGDPCELLRTDAFAADRPGLAEHARHAGSRWLRAAAAGLAEETTTDAPAEVTISVAGGDVRVRPTGPDAWDLSRARTKVQERPVVDPSADRITLALAVTGGVLCLAVVGFPHALAVFSVLAGVGVLIGGGVRWHREREARAHRLAAKETDLARADSLAERTATDLADLHRQLAEVTRTATADLTAIRDRLPG